MQKEYNWVKISLVGFMNSDLNLLFFHQLSRFWVDRFRWNSFNTGLKEIATNQGFDGPHAFCCKERARECWKSNSCHPKCTMWMDNQERGLGPDTGFYFKWNIDSDGKPRGCPGFPSGWKDGHFRHHAWLEPRCPKQDADDGTGQELWKTVEDFADDNELWMREFVASFEKMQTNGYSQLDQGPTGFWKHLQTTVKFDNVLQVIPKWGAQFRVSAYITVTDSHFKHNWENIFQFTKGGSHAQYGDRIPAMWAHRDGYFMISSAVSGDKNHRYKFAYEFGKQYQVVIQQHQKTDGKVMYEIIIDGLLMYEIENTLPKNFTNVKVYLSNKWQQPFDGLMTHFEFTENPSDWSDVLITPNQPPKCKTTLFT